MLFRRSFLSKGLELGIEGGKPFQLELAGPPGVQVSLFLSRRNDARPEAHELDVRCEVTTRREPQPETLECFEQLAQRIPPKGSDLDGLRTWRHLGQDGRFPETLIPPGKYLPESLQGFLAQVRQDLENAAARTVSFIRWRLNRPQVAQPVTASPFDDSYSLDGATWFPMPSNIGVGEVRRIDLHPIPDDLKTEIARRLDSGETEPLAHSLLREAWSLRDTNRKGALLMAIVAAEVGFKRYASKLQPDVEWLMREMPSPPLEKMLRDYFPKIPAKKRIDDQALHVPRVILEALKKGVQIRNEVAHRGDGTLNALTLKAILGAVQDLLWLLDFHSGEEWALAYVRPETLQPDELEGKSAKKKP